MYQFVETIKVKNRIFYDMPYHKKRFDRTRRDFFKIEMGNNDLLDIEIPDSIDNGLYKCRIVYSSVIEKIEFIKYQFPIINSLNSVTCNNIDYSYKYTDRRMLTKLKKDNGGGDDILIIKNGEVSDTSFSNVVFYDGTNYFTPQNPLLNGTMRVRLLDEHKIIEKVLLLEDIWRFKKVFIINALIGIEDNVCIDVKNICNLGLKM